MKRILFPILIVALAINAHAQLLVNPDGNVAIATPNSNFVPNLSIGYNPYFHTGYSIPNIGVAAKPDAKANCYNIAVEGYACSSQNSNSDINFGVLGITEININHGRNYGVSGMVSFGSPNSNSGGAGIYGTNYSYVYSNPDNIQGIYAGYFHGPVNIYGAMTTNAIYTPSDDRLNENVESMARNDEDGTLTLDNLLRMNVLEYNHKSRLDEKSPENLGEMSDDVRASYEMMKKDEEEMASRLHFGLSAQELKEIYPNLVTEGQDGYLSVNYIELVPLLVRSIQVLKQEIDELKSEGGNTKRMPQTAAAPAFSSADRNILYQNSPNPFREKTIIRFKLSDEAKDASICIFDMTGKQLKKVPVSKGMESVSVNCYELGEGIFLYSLIVNGQEIDTKRMILSK
jgi:hypothetical protein